MIRNMKDLRGYAIHATDGPIGEVADLYFDDEHWTVRYLVVDTGGWLSGRKVLISPFAIGQPDWLGQMLPVSLTKAQVERSPDIDTQKPVSRQHEEEYLGYFGYPNYWGGAGLWGLGAYPGGLTAEGRIAEQARNASMSPPAAPGDSHLRSCRTVVGYRIDATDGEIGHVEDFLVDERTWAIRYMVVATSNWWGGHQVLVAPPWIKDVSWPDATVSVRLTRQAVRDAPPYDAHSQLERQQEQAVFEHYGLPDYWTLTAAREHANRT